MKVGVIFVSENQYTEEQILGNTEHTPQFSEFLTLLGDKVRLKGKLVSKYVLTRRPHPNKNNLTGFVW